MDNDSSNNRTSAWLAVMFVVFYLLAIITVNVIINSENFGYRLPRINSYVIGSRWIFYGQK
jgi:hypothetical protein